jgi:multicomponent Na+:H+ antiporter subunit F
MTHGPILSLSLDAAFIMVMLAVVLAFFRLIKGPTLADRVVALDLMTVLIVAFCGLFALDSGVTAFLDVAIVLALIGFLATVALARFIERRVLRRADQMEQADILADTPEGTER